MPSKAATQPPWPPRSPALQETPLPALGGPRQLFRSDHTYDRVSLTTVLRKCRVTLPGGAGAAAEPGVGAGEAGGHPSYVCVAQLDHEVMLVGALPPDCGIPAGGGGGAGC